MPWITEQGLILTISTLIFIMSWCVSACSIWTLACPSRVQIEFACPSVSGRVRVRVRVGHAIRTLVRVSVLHRVYIVLAIYQILF